MRGLVNDRIDLSLHDQRRAFHDAYENFILTEQVCYVELATHSPLAKLDSVSVEELKNIPCILVASKEQQDEEQRFYRDIIGFKGEFLFAQSLHEARMMVVTGRGIMPVEGAGGESFSVRQSNACPCCAEKRRLQENTAPFGKRIIPATM